MRLSYRASVVLLAVTLLLPATAHAAPSVTPTPSPSATVSAPLVTKAAELPRIDVQLWPDDQEVQGRVNKASTIIVTAQLPATVKLPVTIRMPLPEGAQVQWAGEIVSGEDPSKDIQREAVIGNGTGGRYVEFVLQTARIGQYEAVYAETKNESGRRSTALKWSQSVPTGEVAFAVKVPPSAQDVRIEPAPQSPPAANSRGEKLYAVATATLDPGGSFDVDVDYAAAAGVQPAPGRGGADVGTIVPILVVVLVVLLALLIYLFTRQRRSGADE